MEKTFPIHGLDSVCVGIKITSIPGLNEPCSHLPVKISPVPLMLKQPFNGTLNGLSVGLGGISTYFSKVSTMVYASNFDSTFGEDFTSLPPWHLVSYLGQVFSEISRVWDNWDGGFNHFFLAIRLLPRYF